MFLQRYNIDPNKHIEDSDIERLLDGAHAQGKVYGKLVLVFYSACEHNNN